MYVVIKDNKYVDIHYSVYMCIKGIRNKWSIIYEKKTNVKDKKQLLVIKHVNKKNRNKK